MGRDARLKALQKAKTTEQNNKDVTAFITDREGFMLLQHLGTGMVTLDGAQKTKLRDLYKQLKIDDIFEATLVGQGLKLTDFLDTDNEVVTLRPDTFDLLMEVTSGKMLPAHAYYVSELVERFKCAKQGTFKLPDNILAIAAPASADDENDGDGELPPHDVEEASGPNGANI